MFSRYLLAQPRRHEIVEAAIFIYMYVFRLCFIQPGVVMFFYCSGRECIIGVCTVMIAGLGTLIRRHVLCRVT